MSDQTSTRSLTAGASVLTESSDSDSLDSLSHHASEDFTKINPDFVLTDDFKRVRESFDPSVAAILISGLSGIGKTWIVPELLRKLTDNTSLSIFLDGSSLSALAASINDFCRRQNIQLSLTQSFDLLIELFDELNRNFTDKHKLLVIDDVVGLDHNDGLLNVVESMCRKLTMNGSKVHMGKWKIIITSQELDTCDRLQIKHIKYVTLNGFNIAETRELFKSHEDIGKTTLNNIREKLAGNPQAMSELVSYLGLTKSDDAFLGRQLSKEELCRIYLKSVQNGVVTSGVQYPSPSKPYQFVEGIQMSIERICDTSMESHAHTYMSVIKSLACYDERNIPSSLLISVTETVLENDGRIDIKLAEQMSNKFLYDMIRRGMCTKNSDGSAVTFTMHPLVMMSMKMMLNDSPDEKGGILLISLESLNRLMPRRTDHLQTISTVRCLGDHGEALCRILDDVELDKSNQSEKDAILLLQCELLVGMTICRLDDPKYDTYATYDTLEMARSKFSKLVTGKSYYHLLSHHDYRRRTAVRDLAMKLYQSGQNLDISNNLYICDYIARMPLYQKLSSIQLEGIQQEGDIFSHKKHLINGHLTRRAYEECVERRQILSDVTMQPQIHIGELLVRLYHLMSLVDYRDDCEMCSEYSEAGLSICDEIYKQHNVKLLTELVITHDQTLHDVMIGIASDRTHMWEVELSKRLTELQMHRFEAYDAGFFYSEVVSEGYRQLIKTFRRLLHCARLYKSTKDESYKAEGIKEFEALVSDRSLLPHMRSSAYRCYSGFLTSCCASREALLAAISAIMALDAADCTSRHTKKACSVLEYARFRVLYEELNDVYNIYRTESPSENHRTEETTLNAELTEVKYIHKLSDRSAGSREYPRLQDISQDMSSSAPLIDWQFDTDEMISRHIDKIALNIENLNILDDTVGAVTVVWMLSKQTGKSVFHFIAGCLDYDIECNDNLRWISTHDLTNDALRRTIDKQTLDKSDIISQKKKFDLVLNGPSFVVSKALPQILRTDMENSEEIYEFRKEDLLSPRRAAEAEIDDKKLYSYEYRGVSMLIEEPRSPPRVLYFSKIEFSAKMLSEDQQIIENSMRLQETQENVANQVRQFHEPTATSVVTAVVVTTFSRPKQGEPGHGDATVYALPGFHLIKQGRGYQLTHLKSKPKRNWMVSVYHITMAELESLRGINVKLPWDDMTSQHSYDLIKQMYDAENDTAEIKIISTAQMGPGNKPPDPGSIKLEKLNQIEQRLEQVRQPYPQFVASDEDFDVSTYLLTEEVGLFDDPPHVETEAMVTIFRYLAKSLLIADCKNRNVLVKCVESDEVVTDCVIVLAVGDQENVGFPAQFRVSDAFSVVDCRSEVRACDELSQIIIDNHEARQNAMSKEADKVKEQQLAYYEIRRSKSYSSDRSVLVFEQHPVAWKIHSSSNRGNNSSSSLNRYAVLKQEEIEAWMAKEGVKQVQKCHDNGGQPPIDNLFTKFKDEFLKQRLPNSDKHSICKLKAITMCPPNQLHYGGAGDSPTCHQLTHKFDDKAHIPFYREGGSSDDIEDAHLEAAFGFVK